jgi:hypothetical protein
MKNLKKIALATIAILSFGVNAASHISDHYVGVGIAKTNLEKDTLEYNEVNLKLMLGMMVNDSLAAELQFINLDKGEIYNSGGNSGDFEGKSIGIAGVYYMDDVLPIIPFIKLGIHKWDADINISVGGVSASASDDETDLFGGLGVNFVGDNIITRVEYEAYKMGGDVKENMKSFGVSAMFNF